MTPEYRLVPLLLLGACSALLCASAASAASAGRHHGLGAAQEAVVLHQGRAARAARAARVADDNEAEASDVQEAQQGDAQQQEYAEQQEAQEARHFGRLANDDDNYEDEQDIVYDFSYEVKDPHTGNDFGHRQSRAGGLTQGQYRVLLPDGRMQVVDYVSDRDGFRPNIRYEDVGIPVFAGSEQHEQFADGSNHFEQESPAQALAQDGDAQGAQGTQATQGPSPDEVRKRRRRAAPSRPRPHRLHH